MELLDYRKKKMICHKFQEQHYTQCGPRGEMLACEPSSGLPVPCPWLNKNTAPTQHSQKEHLVEENISSLLQSALYDGDFNLTF